MSFEEWRRCRLGEIANVIDSLHKTPTYSEDGYPMVRVTDIQGGYLKLGSTLRVSKEVYDEFSRKHKPTKGDIVFSRVGSYGNSSLVVSDEPFCLGQNTVFILPKVNKRYLYYFLNSSDAKNQIEKLVVGSTQKTISLKSIKEIEVPVPSKDVQTRISAILSSLDDKIELARQTNQTLEAIASAIFKDWFVDFNFPGAAGEMQESDLGEIPKRWSMTTLSSFGKVVCGKTPSKQNKDFYGKEMPFVKIPDMRGSVFVTDTEDGLSEKGALSQHVKTIPAKSVIVSCIATVGLVSMTSSASQTNQQINAIVPDKSFYGYYLFFAIRSMVPLLKDLGSGGSATLNVNTSTFSSIKCIKPAQGTLMAFDKVVDPMLQKVLENEYEIETLVRLRDGLLRKLMKGAFENISK